MTFLKKTEAYTTPHGLTRDPAHAVALHMTKLDKDVNNNDLSVTVMAAVVKHRELVRTLFDELDAIIAPADDKPGDGIDPSTPLVPLPEALIPIVPDGWYLVKATQPHEVRVLPSQLLNPVGMHAYLVEFGRLNRSFSISGEGDTLAEAWREAVENVERHEIERAS